MNPISLIAIFIGGGLGSLLRYIISRAFLNLGFSAKAFPVATLVINILACLIMGLVLYYGVRSKTDLNAWKEFWLIGFCGGFSTFSTFSYENWILYKNQSFAFMGLNMFLSVALCLGVFILLHKLINV